MTLRRSVLTPRKARREHGPSLAVHVAMVAITAFFVGGDILFILTGNARRDTSIQIRLDLLQRNLDETRICTLSLEVQTAMDRGERVRIVGAGTCEEPLRLEK
jgi:hypothetical protein